MNAILDGICTVAIYVAMTGTLSMAVYGIVMGAKGHGMRWGQRDHKED